MLNHQSFSTNPHIVINIYRSLFIFFGPNTKTPQRFFFLRKSQVPRTLLSLKDSRTWTYSSGYGSKRKPNQEPQVAESIFPFTNRVFYVPGIPLTHCQVFFHFFTSFRGINTSTPCWRGLCLSGDLGRTVKSQTGLGLRDVS